MRVLRLKLDKTRSFRSVDWTPEPLEVVIGPNTAGKSNLFDGIELVSRSARGELDSWIRGRGGFSAFAHDGSADELAISVKLSPVDKKRDVDRDSLTYNLSLQSLQGGLSYAIGQELLGNYYKVERGEREEPLKLLERTPRHAVVFDEQERALMPQSPINEAETLVSRASGPLTCNRLVAAVQRELADWTVLRRVAMRPADLMVTRRDLRLRDDASNLGNVLHTACGDSRAYRETLEKDLRPALGGDFAGIGFAPVGEGQTELRLEWKSGSRPMPFLELSPGLQRFIAMHLLLSGPTRPPVVAIESPEAELQPALLHRLIDLARDSQDGELGQVLFSTVSPALLDAFGDHLPAVTRVERGAEGSTLASLEGKAVEEWLDQFSLLDSRV